MQRGKRKAKREPQSPSLVLPTPTLVNPVLDVLARFMVDPHAIHHRVPGVWRLICDYFCCATVIPISTSQIQPMDTALLVGLELLNQRNWWNELATALNHGRPPNVEIKFDYISHCERMANGSTTDLTHSSQTAGATIVDMDERTIWSNLGCEADGSGNHSDSSLLSEPSKPNVPIELIEAPPLVHALQCTCITVRLRKPIALTLFTKVEYLDEPISRTEMIVAGTLIKLKLSVTARAPHQLVYLVDNPFQSGTSIVPHAVAISNLTDSYIVSSVQLDISCLAEFGQLQLRVGAAVNVLRGIILYDALTYSFRSN